MDTHADDLAPPSRLLLLAEARALIGLGAFAAAAPWLRTAPRGDGHPVMVLPGLGATDASTQPMRGFLAELGYDVRGWQMGRNVGRRNLVDAQLVPRLLDWHARSGRAVSLVGWSLGGILAREMARRAPQCVRCVITLASPFAGGARSTNVARLFEDLSGRRVLDDPALRRRLRTPPPVPLTAIFSRTDGVVAWRACLEQPSPRAENVEVRGSHCGLGHHPAALWVIADRLARPPGDWAPFSPPAALRWLFPDPRRAPPHPVAD